MSKGPWERNDYPSTCTHTKGPEVEVDETCGKETL